MKNDIDAVGQKDAKGREKNVKGVKKRPPSRRDKHAPLGAKTTPPPSRHADPAFPRGGKVAERREAGCAYRAFPPRGKVAEHSEAG